jgi:hypothetical protein
MVDLTLPCDACGKMIGGSFHFCPKCKIFFCGLCAKILDGYSTQISDRLPHVQWRVFMKISLKSVQRRTRTRLKKMPIDNIEWDSGKVYPVEDRIMSFLNKKDNVNRAFNLVSIMEGLGYLVTKEPISYELAIQVRKALDELVEAKKIERKKIKETIGEEPYYKTIQSSSNIG